MAQTVSVHKVFSQFKNFDLEQHKQSFISTVWIPYKTLVLHLCSALGRLTAYTEPTEQDIIWSRLSLFTLLLFWQEMQESADGGAASSLRL